MELISNKTQDSALVLRYNSKLIAVFPLTVLVGKRMISEIDIPRAHPLVKILRDNFDKIVFEKDFTKWMVQNMMFNTNWDIQVNSDYEALRFSLDVPGHSVICQLETKELIWE